MVNHHAVGVHVVIELNCIFSVLSVIKPKFGFGLFLGLSNSPSISAVPEVLMVGYR